MTNFASAVASVRTGLLYGKTLANIHATLVGKGWAPTEAHFIIRAAQLLNK